MVFTENQFIVPESLYWKGVLQDVSKTRSAFQPIFEAFTNAMEAIKIKQRLSKELKGEIVIQIHATESTVVGSFHFSSLSVSDNGIGFDDEQFKRFNTFKDITKGYKNLGSGRLQYVHYFDNTIVKSTYAQDGKIFEREFHVSKKQPFIDQNSIVFHKNSQEISPSPTGTTLVFNSLLENSNLYNELDARGLKEQLLKRYIHYFCHNKRSLPEIIIKFYVQGELKGQETIAAQDIPNTDKEDLVKIHYKRVASNGKSLEETKNSADFKIDAFKIASSILDSNDLKLVSKGEIVEESEVKLESLPKNESIRGSKYIFLVASDYIDSRDSNIRGELKIPNYDSLVKGGSLFSTEEIFIEDIKQQVNEKIIAMYPEIEEVKQHHIEQLESLKEMFLLDDETANDITISINDSEAKILEKFYEAEAKKTATIDASIKASIDNLDRLDTTDPKYSERLKKEVDILVKSIPLQNKKSLTHYVARRKLVLDLFDKLLQRKLTVQRSGRDYDEELIHDLLFQQGSSDSENSDLWIINEDFIYFKGSSNLVLSKVEIHGEKMFKETFTDEEERYLKSLGENRKIKKPDILLFPEEGKCVILEFKAPNVNASDHLTQIDKYASLIRNYTQDKFQITTFYGYLIGESIEPKDVLGAVSSFEESYQFDYLFRPSTKVIGFDGRTNGSIYTEVIKYTTLLQRARQRNKIFIDKLHS